MYLRFLQDSRTFAICKVSWTLGNGDSAENCEDVRFLSWQVWRHLACGVKSPDGVISFRWLTDRRHEGFELPKEKGVAAGVCFSDIDMYDLSHTPRMMRTISHYQVRIIVRVFTLDFICLTSSLSAAISWLPHVYRGVCFVMLIWAWGGGWLWLVWLWSIHTWQSHPAFPGSFTRRAAAGSPCCRSS